MNGHSYIYTRLLLPKPSMLGTRVDTAQFSSNTAPTVYLGPGLPWLPLTNYVPNPLSLQLQAARKTPGPNESIPVQLQENSSMHLNNFN